jgi:DNA primase catalytic core
MKKQTVEELKGKYSLLEEVSKVVQLTRKGNEHWGCCPFHGENTPSFKVSEKSGKFKCFGCGKNGDVIDFMREINGIDLLDCGTSENSVLSDINKAASDIFRQCLLDDAIGAEAARYLKERGVSAEIAEKYQIGFAPDDWEFVSSRLIKMFNAEDIITAGLSAKKKGGLGLYDKFRGRIMFPVISQSGLVLGFSGRSINGSTAKYLNSSDSNIFNKKKSLLGLRQASGEIRKADSVVIVEGNFDMVSLSAAGVGNVISTLGTALTADHINYLKKRCSKGVIFFDGDEAGRKASLSAAKLCFSKQFDVSVASASAGEDPDSLVSKGGAESIGKVIADARPSFEYIIDCLVKEFGTTVSGAAKAAQEAMEVANSVESQVGRQVAQKAVCDRFGVPFAGAEQSQCAGENSGEGELSKVEQFAIFFPEYRGLIPLNMGGVRLAKICKSNSVDELGGEFSGEDRRIISEQLMNGCPFEECEVDIKSKDDIIDFISADRDLISLTLPSSVIYPGGLIDLGMRGLSSPGLPKQWQFSFPVVCSVIGAVVCDKISAAGVIPNSYAVRLAVSGGGKSEIDKRVQEVMVRHGLDGILGPQKFASGPAVISNLMNKPNMLCFLDEVTGYLARNGRGERELNGMTNVLLELYGQSGSVRGYESVYSNKDDNKKIDWFSFSFVGNCTPNVFKAIDQDSIGSGLVSRIDFFCYLGRLQKRGVWRGYNEDLLKFGEALSFLSRRSVKSDEGSKINELSLEQVSKRLDQLEDEIFELIGSDYKNNSIVALYNKIFKDALRYSMIHHAATQPLHCLYDPIEPESMEWGIAVAKELAKWKANKLVNNLNYGEFDADCAVFLEALRAANSRYLAGKEGRPNRKTISAKRRATRNWPSIRWEQIIDSLSKNGDIRVDGDYYFPL